MEPFSITTGALSIVGMISTLTVTVSSFMRQLRDARNDLDVVMRELVSLKIVLEILADEASNLGPNGLPMSLTTQVRGILDGCGRVVAQIEETLSRFEGNNLLVKSQWVLGGRADMDKLRTSLEAHKSALCIALDMLSLSITKDIKENTSKIKGETATIKQDTTEILALITRLEQLQLANAQPEAKDQFMLQRYLDALTTYAGSVYQESIAGAVERLDDVGLSDDNSSLHSLSAVTEECDVEDKRRHLSEDKGVTTLTHVVSASPTVSVQYRPGGAISAPGASPPKETMVDRPQLFSNSSTSLHARDLSNTRSESSNLNSNGLGRHWTFKETMRSVSTPDATSTTHPEETKIENLIAHDASASAARASLKPAAKSTDKDEPNSSSEQSELDPGISDDDLDMVRVRDEQRPMDRLDIGIPHNSLRHVSPVKEVNTVARRPVSEAQALESPLNSPTRLPAPQDKNLRLEGERNPGVPTITQGIGQGMKRLLGFGNEPISTPTLRERLNTSRGLDETPTQASTITASEEWMPLHIAAENGDTVRVKRLLIEGADINARDGKYGQTTLYQAAKNGHDEVVSLLLNLGADLRLKSTSGWAPLHAAAYNGHIATTKSLLMKGADVNARTRNLKTPLHKAALKGHDEIVSLLLGYGANPEIKSIHGRTPLHAAANNGHIATAKSLLMKGADINARTSNLETPLYIAAWKGHDEIVSLLLGYGGSPKIKSTSRWTPLHIAAKYGHIAIAKSLLMKGADVNARTSSSLETPLYIAAWKGHDEIVSLLLGYSANPEIKSTHGWTPLHTAAQNGHIATAKSLLMKGADVNARASYLQTPLYRAAKNGHDEVVSLLLNLGADVQLKSTSGWTPLHTAAYNGHIATAKSLLMKGADVNARTSNLKTPLHKAALKGHDEIVSLLLGYGANPEIKSTHGRTPLHTAANNGHIATAKSLLMKGADVNAMTSNLETPLYTAAWKGHEMVSLLLDYGANPEI